MLSPPQADRLQWLEKQARTNNPALEEEFLILKSHQEKCYAQCNCPTEQRIIGDTYYECTYGECCGHKCEVCDNWVISQEGRNCSRYDIPKAETPA